VKHYPPIQVVNQADEPVRGAPLKEIYEQSLPHRIVYIACEDPGGKILLQKRGPNMATYANCWDISAAGHVDEGETYLVAARREVREELGLAGFELREIDSYYDEIKPDGLLLKRFCKVYKIAVPGNVTLKPDPEEVVETCWLSFQEAEDLLAGHPDQIAAGLLLYIERRRAHESH